MFATFGVGILPLAMGAVLWSVFREFVFTVLLKWGKAWRRLIVTTAFLESLRIFLADGRVTDLGIVEQPQAIT